MNAAAAADRHRLSPLDVLYTGTFAVSLGAIFVELMQRVRTVMLHPDFGSLSRDYFIVAIVGSCAGFVHHFAAYRALGHMAERGGGMAERLTPWVNSTKEYVLRWFAMIIMVFAVAKASVVTKLLPTATGPAPLRCAFVGGTCVGTELAVDVTTPEQYIFFVAGVALALTLLAWSIGAFVKAERSAELLLWIITDLIAVAFWGLFLLLIIVRINRVAVWWSICAAVFAILLAVRYSFKFLVLPVLATNGASVPGGGVGGGDGTTVQEDVRAKEAPRPESRPSRDTSEVAPKAAALPSSKTQKQKGDKAPKKSGRWR